MNGRGVPGGGKRGLEIPMGRSEIWVENRLEISAPDDVIGE